MNEEYESEDRQTLDDLIAKMERDEYEGAEKLSPIDFARYQEMSPQMVYYYIRNNVVEVEVCICGRKVVDVEAAREAIRTRQNNKGRKG